MAPRSAERRGHTPGVQVSQPDTDHQIRLRSGQMFWRYTRTLPAHLIVQICRQAYIHWADKGDFENLESTLRTGMHLVLRALSPLPV